MMVVDAVATVWGILHAVFLIGNLHPMALRYQGVNYTWWFWIAGQHANAIFVCIYLFEALFVTIIDRIPKPVAVLDGMYMNITIPHFSDISVVKMCCTTIVCDGALSPYSHGMNGQGRYGSQ